MGEKIKKYTEIKIGDELFDIELNKPHTAGEPYSIHIQNPKFRMEMRDFEFARMLAAVVFARKQLSKLKEHAFDEQSGSYKFD